MMKVPENPYRKALAGIYMDDYLGRPEGDVVKKAVNGDEDDRSLDYYVGVERMINYAIDVFRKLDQKELHGSGAAFSMMLYYVSYEIERLSAFKDKD
jgi:hypothetical protein